jgi:hypothetical protein
VFCGGFDPPPYRKKCGTVMRDFAASLISHAKETLLLLYDR